MAKLNVTINGVSGEVEEGSTVLQAAKELGVSLAHYCFGNAICNTCRVEVIRNAENLSDKAPKEKVSLNYHLSFSDDIRLACQAKVQGDGVECAAWGPLKYIAPPKFGKKKSKEASK